MDVRGKRVLVVGLARSGREAARCLASRGAIVTVTDSRPPSAFQAEIRQLSAQKVGLELGQHCQQTFLRQDLIVVSPGVPWDMAQLVAARQHGVKVVPEIEAASWFLKGPIVGITGSNGKTTTTALLGKMIKASGFSTFVGGNIGVPLISAVDNTSPDTILVTELSSFQLEAIQAFRPHVAVLLNLTPNHLDRHPSFEAYVSAKAQIFRNQTENDWAVLNADDPAVMNLVPTLMSRKVFFSRRRSLPEGVFVSNGEVRYRVANLERSLMPTREVTLRGAFNLENVLAASTAACLMGADFGAVRQAVREFQGVEHRLEYVRTIRGVEFYNDSKATSVDATAKALTAFERGVHLILGGKDKGAPYAPLRPLMQGRVRDVLLIGAAADRIERELRDMAVVVRAGDLETAVNEAFRRAVPGEAVLLAPACASFDQFEDYEHRGRVFKKLASDLARAVEEGAPSAAPIAQMELSPPAEAAGPQPLGAAPEPPHDSGLAPSARPMSMVVDEPKLTVPPAPPDEVASGPAVRPAPPSSEDQASPASKSPATPDSAANAQAPRELTYIYEIGVDELPPAESDSTPEDHGEFDSAGSKEPGPVETVEDEALLFEVRAADGGQTVSPQREEPRAGSASSRGVNGASRTNRDGSGERG